MEDATALGLIPAHAGKTQLPPLSGEYQGAHPRSRGENAIVVGMVREGMGSSPLTRGKHQTPPRRVGKRGLIPAHAGKTSVSVIAAYLSGAHPRSRGENGPRGTLTCPHCGSSPLTRGKRVSVEGAGHLQGLIPAHAGKTLRSRKASGPRWAHPRSRGENDKGGDGTGTGPGSSPLTRGKHFLTCAFIAQIDQILESLELCASSESYSSWDAYATDAPQDRARSIGLVPRSSRGASSA